MIHLIGLKLLLINLEETNKFQDIAKQEANGKDLMYLADRKKLHMQIIIVWVDIGFHKDFKWPEKLEHKIGFDQHR